ncbi:cupin domain-containing protein [Agromyces aerolatus]|uniref:cupin domain-containing protein n=1 Tax=Agromyces sp. LY-1074 TaxID=3074080 RepID=UPI0028679D24|nr:MULTISPECIES: cupin domain-containing protein [unclassified Agromyces]MDR5701642.1 cupin domain-containing protein [Agromyces sp. LY-1074]MDR5707918.1 cupin domain-containing protein [Agromyces sp. LY-1358]
MTAPIHLTGTSVESILQPRGIRPGADRGTPLVRSTAVASGDGAAGIWESEPGGWPVLDRADTEVCYIQSGSGTVTDLATGQTFELRAGDLLVLPEGWSGRWDVHETLRKVYVTY